jgi:hypothetical protein
MKNADTSSVSPSAAARGTSIWSASRNHLRPSLRSASVITDTSDTPTSRSGLRWAQHRQRVGA